MIPRSATLRWMTWACAWTLTLLVARTAGAAAPMCDERGASIIAPPPVLQARNVKLEAAFPTGCDDPFAPRAAFGPRTKGQPRPVANENKTFDDAGVRPTVPGLPELTPRHAIDGSTVLLTASPGYGRDVFRPPRA
jgi:hypothetical protein